MSLPTTQIFPDDRSTTAIEVDEVNSNIVYSSKIAVGEDTHRGVRFFRLELLRETRSNYVFSP
jgi:hypothetical protein